jgi:hypothetical protein
MDREFSSLSFKIEEMNWIYSIHVLQSEGNLKSYVNILYLYLINIKVGVCPKHLVL